MKYDEKIVDRQVGRNADMFAQAIGEMKTLEERYPYIRILISIIEQAHPEWNQAPTKDGQISFLVFHMSRGTIDRDEVAEIVRLRDEERGYTFIERKSEKRKPSEKQERDEKPEEDQEDTPATDVSSEAAESGEAGTPEKEETESIGEAATFQKVYPEKPQPTQEESTEKPGEESASDASDDRPGASDSPDDRPEASDSPDDRLGASDAPDDRPGASDAPDDRSGASDSPDDRPGDSDTSDERPGA